MIWLWVVVIVVIIGAVVVVAVGRDDAMADVYDDRPDTTMPTGRPLTADDLDQIRFTTGFRGYRMDEVDAFVTRLQADLLAREQHTQPDQQAALGHEQPDQREQSEQHAPSHRATDTEPGDRLDVPDEPDVIDDRGTP